MQNYQEPPRQQPKKVLKKRKKHHPIRNIFLIILLIVGGYGIFAYGKIKSTLDDLTTTKVKLDAETVSSRLKSGKPVSILLLGTDTGALDRTDNGRTDTMMVLTLNKSSKKSLLVSLQRDTRITWNKSYVKLNAAYAYGGVNGSVSKVESLLDIRLNGFVLVNMGGLEKVVNALDGVSVTSPLTYDYEGYHFTKGQTYNVKGNEMLAFVRMRYDDPEGDYGRQKRQQLVIKAIVKEALTNQLTVTNEKFLKALTSNIQTDLTSSDMIKMGIFYSGSLNNLKTDQMIGKGIMSAGVSYQLMTTTEINRVHNEIVDIAEQ